MSKVTRKTLEDKLVIQDHDKPSLKDIAVTSVNKLISKGWKKENAIEFVNDIIRETRHTYGD